MEVQRNLRIGAVGRCLATLFPFPGAVVIKLFLYQRETADKPAKVLSIIDPVLWLATLAIGHGDYRAAMFFQQPENFRHCSCVPVFVANVVAEPYVLDGAYAYDLIKDPVSESC